MHKIVPVSDTQSPTFQGNYVDAVPSGYALVVATPETASNAIFGGLLASRASVLGAAGIVTDGLVRDVREIAQLGLPVRTCLFHALWRGLGD